MQNSFLNNPWDNIKNNTKKGGDIIGARILAIFGDSITTDPRLVNEASKDRSAANKWIYFIYVNNFLPAQMLNFLP